MELPPFSSSSFINREAEITLVSGKVHQLRKGMQVRPRTLIFRGERGVGKTWLCLHLKRSVLANEANVDRVLTSPARILWDIRPRLTNGSYR
ncbi:MAG: hypothetical protein IPK16_25530 [Anaerolineales bacterium]|nr:hypothetical protein [Anaerolineales bacterium]